MIDPKVVVSCTEIWNQSYPSRYRVDDQAIIQSLSSPTTILDKIVVDQDLGQVLAIKKSGTPDLFAGQDHTRGHVALFASVGSADPISLIQEACDIAREAGLSKLVFGMDPDHLLPGVPEEMVHWLSALESIGFVEIGRCFDLERDLGDYEVPDECLDALGNVDGKVYPCDVGDIPGLDQFFLNEFPGRWRHDVMRKIVEDDEADKVYLLIVNGAIEGFAMTQRQGCVRPISGANWRLELGSNWGALGPIGISKNVRGKGLGNALLGYALLGLKQAGARQTIIDWTTLGDFYGHHGFSISRRYIQFSKSLA